MVNLVCTEESMMMSYIIKTINKTSSNPPIVLSDNQYQPTTLYLCRHEYENYKVLYSPFIYKGIPLKLYDY